MSDAKEKGLVLDLEEKVVQAGHWCLYEKPEEIARVIGEWLQKRFPGRA
jgi:soluble epoxide hydrolase / lipid-phosphate phosphatase